MIKFILTGKNTYNAKERAKAILFAGASVKDFKKSFTFNNTIYYTKIK